MYHRLQQQQLRGWCGKVTTRATAVEGGVLRRTLTRASWEMKRTSETTRGCVLAGPRPEAGEEAALALVLSSCIQQSGTLKNSYMIYSQSTAV